jgi:hypothetical protein
VTGASAIAVLLLGLAALPVPGETPGTEPEQPAAGAATSQAPVAEAPVRGGWRWSGSFRSRVEVWDWFNPPPTSSPVDDHYAFLGGYARLSLAGTFGRVELATEGSIPVLLGLPDRASLPPPQGQLGQGASYRDANGDRVAFAFVRQAYLRVARFPDEKSALKVGRFEFVEGQEGVGQDATLDWLKRERIAQRLVAHFGFTHVQRTTDGVELSRRSNAWHVLAAAGRFTKGVFKLDANPPVRGVWLTYAGVTRATPAQDLRLFHIFYRDSRDVTKVDARPPESRLADTQSIDISTAGAHLARRVGRADVLLYGALQTGRWGTQSHLAGAWLAEAGYQPEMRGRPWVRVGLNQGSGDGDALDDRHGTFFQIAPTARIYARFPFFNMMNSQDAFLMSLLRPHSRVTLRVDVHALRLSNSSDLWYLGGGVFDSQVFGFAGRPSWGHRDLATLADLQVDFRPDERTGLALYYGHARGGDVVGGTFPAGRRANLAFVELSRRF